MPATCPLCDGDGGRVVARDAALRIVLVDDDDYPGFARVVCNAHVAEMSDLDAAHRDRLMAVVCAVERAQRAVMRPQKVNVASLGNVVPHLHWHVIPRYADDAHFPQPIWGTRQRDVDRAVLDARRARVPALAAALQEILRETR